MSSDVFGAVRYVDGAVNPFTASWIGRAVRNGTAANIAILANAGTSGPILGIVVDAEDKLGGQITVALPGSACNGRLAASGQPNVNQSGALTANSTGYLVPAALGDYVCAIIRESKAHGASDMVPVVVVFGCMLQDLA